ncbi:MAG: hypothetical protein R2698_08155 [Microthrixaceae bacterium]
MVSSAFTGTWWGRAWIEAVERLGADDEDRLAQGRVIARTGRVEGLRVAVGRVTAAIHVDESGRATTPNRTGADGSAAASGRLEPAWEVATLDEPTWQRFFAAWAEHGTHAAALSVGELDPRLISDMATEGVSVVPSAADLVAVCPCGDSAAVCSHAAAVAYALAARLDRDPLVLSELRGLGRDVARSRLLPSGRSASVDDDIETVTVDELLDSLAGGSTEPPAAVDGRRSAVGIPEVTADGDTWRPSHTRPGRLGVPAGARRWRAGSDTWPVEQAPGGPSLRLLEAMIDDAAERAWATLHDGASSGLAADVRGDLARRAAGADRDAVEWLAERSGQSPDALHRWARAWRIGGDDAVAVVADEDSWVLDQDRLAAGRDELVDAGIAKRSIALSYDSLGMPGDVKVVIGPDGRWYRLRMLLTRGATRRHFELLGAPSPDIADVVELDTIP